MNNKTRDNEFDIFSLKDNEGEDKVTSLEKAVAAHIMPGMNIYIAPEGGAAICQLIRQFWGTSPAFDLTIVGTTEHALNLVQCGLLKKLITTNCSHIYPTPGLSRIIQDSYKEKKIEIENWTLYSHLQRLMAGALGVGFLSTKSVIDSDMAEENRDSFLVMDDPFGGVGKVGLVKALNPDIAIIHGWAADPHGNTISVPISSQVQTDHKMWGAKASKNGVIVTVEKIVSTDFIRKYPALVTLPGYLVKSVCHVPFGAHPQGMLSPIAGLFDSYAPDYEFVAEHRLACQKPSEIESWIKKWVLDCKNQEEYINRLGGGRINLIKEKANEDYWKKNYNDIIDKATTDRVPNEIEIMIMTAARKVAEIMRKNNYRILLGGLGAGMLASWVAYYQLRQRNYDIDLIVGSGSFGFAPRPGDSFYGTYSNMHSCKAFFDTADTYGYILSGNNKRSLSILGAAQIDKYGNINSTKMGNNYLLGSGGANDAINASEVLIVVKQSRQRFINKVPYVTCPGRNVKTLVSDMGIFEKVDDSREFKLTACLPDTEGTGLKERIRRIKDNCGWELKLATEVKESPMPDQEDFLTMRLFDPERLVIGDGA